MTDRSGAAFPSFEAFCREPQPFGLGYALDAINGIIDERRSAEARARAPKEIKRQGRPSADDNRDVLTVSERGGSADYLTARIARDRPDILERMRAGAYPSVRAAALEAGIVRRRISVPAESADAAARALARHFDVAELIAG